MTLGEVQPFFADRLSGLGLKEWSDGFNVANIPSNILDGSFHVMVGNLSLGVVQQQVHEFKLSVTARLFFKGYRNPQTAKNIALNKAQEVFNDLLKPSVRLDQMSNLKDIRPVSCVASPLADSNDNSLILELVFECFLIYRFS